MVCDSPKITDPLESTLLNWIHPKTLPKTKKLTPSNATTGAASFVGVTVLISLAVWFCFSGFLYLIPKMDLLDFKRFIPGSSLLPFASIIVGLLALYSIRNGVVWPLIRVRMLTIVVLPLGLLSLALPLFVLNAFGCGFLLGLSMLVMEPRWDRLRGSGQARKASVELFVITLVLIFAFLIVISILNNEFNLTFLLINGALFFISTAMSRYSFLSMLSFLCALRADNDKDGDRSAAIVLFSVLLWPIWFIDRSGYLITGNVPRD